MRIGHVWRIRPGREEEYERRHAEVWPELEALFRRLGVSEYHIYRWDSVVFSHLVVEDYDRLRRNYEQDPVACRWEQEFGDLLTYPNADPEYGWPEQLRHVWSMRAAPPSGE